MRNTTYIVSIIMMLLLGTSSIYSQNTAKNVYIKTKDNAILYKLYENETYEKGVTGRHLVNLNGRKKKILEKSTEVKLTGITNSNAQFHYDTYIVTHKGKTFFIHKNFIQSNEYLDSINQTLDKEYQSLIYTIESLSYSSDSLKEELKNQISNKIKIIKEREKQLPHVIDSVEQQASKEYQAKNDKEFIKKYNSWYNGLPSSAKRAAKAISINEARLLSPNSAGGCDYRFEYTNNSDKTIKYLYWSGWIYNAVDDIVYCNIRDYGNFRGKDTGPVATGETGGGTWDCIVYNYSARSVKLNSVEIQYMDNSRITISETDIKRLLKEPKKKSPSWSAIDSVKKSASATLKKELQNYKDSIIELNRLYRVFESNNFKRSDISDYTQHKGVYNHFTQIAKQIQELEQRISIVETEIDSYKTNNFMNEVHNYSIITKQEEEVKKHNNIKEKNKKVRFGTGLDFLISDEYLGMTIPLEVIFGSYNNFVNFSISGEYTYLNSLGGLYINKFGTFATLHLNFGKKGTYKFPLSLSFGYSKNLGNKIYNVTGWYYDNDYNEKQLSFPITMNDDNLSSVISFGVRSVHWKVAAYIRLDITPVYDRTLKDVSIPKDEYIFYDDYKIEDLLNYSDRMPLFGILVRYYF